MREKQILKYILCDWICYLETATKINFKKIFKLQYTMPMSRSEEHKVSKNIGHSRKTIFIS